MHIYELLQPAEPVVQEKLRTKIAGAALAGAMALGGASQANTHNYQDDAINTMVKHKEDPLGAFAHEKSKEQDARLSAIDRAKIQHILSLMQSEKDAELAQRAPDVQPSSIPKLAAVTKPVTKQVDKPVVPKAYKPVTGLAVETALHNFAVKLGIKGTELAAFMGQSAHESDGFKTVKEYASGAAYEGRRDLGNTQPGDGVKYKGRGFIQITGRANYTEAGKALNLDLVNHPELAETPANAAKVTWWYWKNKVRPAIGNFSNTLAVTKKVNGGINGLKAREKYTQSFRSAQN